MTVGGQEKIKWYQSFYFLVVPIFLLSAEKRTNKFKKPPLNKQFGKKKATKKDENLHRTGTLIRDSMVREQISKTFKRIN